MVDHRDRTASVFLFFVSFPTLKLKMSSKRDAVDGSSSSESSSSDSDSSIMNALSLSGAYDTKKVPIGIAFDKRGKGKMITTGDIDAADKMLDDPNHRIPVNKGIRTVVDEALASQETVVVPALFQDQERDPFEEYMKLPYASTVPIVVYGNDDAKKQAAILNRAPVVRFERTIIDSVHILDIRVVKHRKGVSKDNYTYGVLVHVLSDIDDNVLKTSIGLKQAIRLVVARIIRKNPSDVSGEAIMAAAGDVILDDAVNLAPTRSVVPEHTCGLQSTFMVFGMSESLYQQAVSSNFHANAMIFLKYRSDLEQLEEQMAQNVVDHFEYLAGGRGSGDADDELLAFA